MTQELINPMTPLEGTGPWLAGEFRITSGQAIKISAYGLTANDTICVRQLYLRQDGNATHQSAGCAVECPDPPAVIASIPYTYCGAAVCLCEAQPIIRIRDPGNYVLEFSGSGFDARQVIVTGEQLMAEDVSDAMLEMQCEACGGGGEGGAVPVQVLLNCAGEVHESGTKVPSCVEMTQAIGTAVDAIPTLLDCAGQAHADNAQVPSCDEMNQAIDEAIPTDAEIASVFNDCTGAPQQPGAALPTCAQMSAAIDEAIGALPEPPTPLALLDCKNQAIVSGTKVATCVDLTEAIAEIPDAPTPLALLDCEDQPIASGTKVATCVDLANAISQLPTAGCPPGWDVSLAANGPNWDMTVSGPPGHMFFITYITATGSGSTVSGAYLDSNGVYTSTHSNKPVSAYLTLPDCIFDFSDTGPEIITPHYNFVMAYNSGSSGNIAPDGAITDIEPLAAGMEKPRRIVVAPNRVAMYASNNDVSPPTNTATLRDIGWYFIDPVDPPAFGGLLTADPADTTSYTGSVNVSHVTHDSKYLVYFQGGRSIGDLFTAAIASDGSLTTLEVGAIQTSIDARNGLAPFKNSGKFYGFDYGAQTDIHLFDVSSQGVITSVPAPLPQNDIQAFVSGFVLNDDKTLVIFAGSVNSQQSYVRTYDISIPAAPVLVDTFDFTGSGYKQYNYNVAASGDRIVAVATNDNLSPSERITVWTVDSTGALTNMKTLDMVLPHAGHLDLLYDGSLFVTSDDTGNMRRFTIDSSNNISLAPSDTTSNTYRDVVLHMTDSV
jgi:hypothetical protein